MSATTIDTVSSLLKQLYPQNEMDRVFTEFAEKSRAVAGMIRAAREAPRRPRRIYKKKQHTVFDVIEKRFGYGWRNQALMMAVTGSWRRSGVL